MLDGPRAFLHRAGSKRDDLSDHPPLSLSFRFFPLRGEGGEGKRMQEETRCRFGNTRTRATRIYLRENLTDVRNRTSILFLFFFFSFLFSSTRTRICINTQNCGAGVCTRTKKGGDLYHDRDRTSGTRQAVTEVRISARLRKRKYALLLTFVTCDVTCSISQIVPCFS